MNEFHCRITPVSILYKSIAGRYRPVRVADGPITARYRFIKNASWDMIKIPVLNYCVIALVHIGFKSTYDLMSPLAQNYERNSKPRLKSQPGYSRPLSVCRPTRAFAHSI